MQLNTSTVISDGLLQALRDTYALDWHGIDHWRRVRENGLRIASENGADVVIVELFAFLHDAKRATDGHDPHHGQRASEWMRTLDRGLLPVGTRGLEQLTYACAHHTRGLTEADVTVQTCWDADRLDLARVDIIPEADRLCTDVARRPDVLSWAIQRSRAQLRNAHPD
jgi:uncharacterized protein